MRRLIVMIIISALIIPSVSTGEMNQISTSKHFEPSQFTLQTFNRDMNVTTFVGPDYSNETLTHFLDSVEESLYIEIYQFTSPGILAKLHEIYNANPSLDIKVLISERVVSLGDFNVYTAWNLTQIGIPVRWTSDTFTFSHQKMVIIDNKTTIIQAGNLAKPSFPLNDWQSGSSTGFTQKNYAGNREFNIAMTDTVVTEYYRNVFDNDWTIGTDYNEGVDGTGTILTWEPLSQTYYQRVFDYTGEFSGQMNVTPLISPDTSLEAMLWVINSAQATLDIQIPYISNSSTYVDQILDALLAAKQRGVTVRIITEDGRNDNVEVAEFFALANIPVCWMDTRFFATLHNKAFIADSRIVLISSINWSEESINENRETGVIVEYDAVGAWYQAVFDYDWGIAGCDATGEVNVGWYPHIPKSSTITNVTVYAHELYNDVDDVILAVKIGPGAWTNHTITSNVYLSSENAEENYFYEISPQADGTNITVQAFVQAAGVWYRGLELVIPIRDSLGSVVTTSPTTTTTTEDPMAGFLAEFGVWLAIAGIGIICGGGSAVAYKKGMLPGAKKKTRRRRKKK